MPSPLYALPLSTWKKEASSSSYWINASSYNVMISNAWASPSYDDLISNLGNPKSFQSFYLQNEKGTIIPTRHMPLHVQASRVFLNLNNVHIEAENDAFLDLLIKVIPHLWFGAVRIMDTDIRASDDHHPWMSKLALLLLYHDQPYLSRFPWLKSARILSYTVVLRPR